MAQAAKIFAFLVSLYFATCRPGSAIGDPLEEDAFDGKSLVGRFDSGQCICLSPDGQRFIATTKSGAVIVDTDTCKVIAPITTDTQIRTAGFSPDGTLVVISGTDGVAHVLEVPSGKPALQPVLPLAHFYSTSTSITTAAFSSDGREIMTVSSEWVRIWDAKTGKHTAPPIRTTNVHSENFATAKLSADGKLLLTQDLNGHPARLWDARTGKMLFVLEDKKQAFMSWVYCAAFSPDGKRIATGEEYKRDLSSTREYACFMWDSKTGKVLFRTPRTQWPPCSVAFSSDGSKLAVGAGGVRIFNASSGEPTSKQMGNFSLVSRGVKFTRDGARVVTFGPYAHARVWDISSQTLILNASNCDFIDFAAFNPEGTRLVTGAEGRTYLWTVPRGSK